jgi:flagellin-like protein
LLFDCKSFEIKYGGKLLKKLTKLRRSVKAISPVISVLLMIAIAVAAALIAYAWVTGYMDFTTTKVGKAIQIQSISTTAVYVQNIGDSKVTLNDLYINGDLDDAATAAIQGVELDPSETLGITAFTNTAAFAEEQITVKIVTTDGTRAEYTETFSGNTGGGGGGTTYTITVTQTANGVITPGTGDYDESSTPSFTIDPNDGYYIASITANGAPVTVTDPMGQTYQFPALAADGDLTATYALVVVTEVQHREVGIAVPGPATTSFNSAPTAGNLLVITTGHRLQHDATPVDPSITTPAGWNFAYIQRSDPWSGSHRRVIAIFWKISAGAADQSVTISSPDVDSGTGFANLQEFSANVPVTWDIVDVNGANGGNSVTYSILTVPSPPLSAPTKTNILAIAGMVWRDTPNTPRTYTSYTLGNEHFSTASTANSATAYVYTNAGDHTWTTTVDWPNNRIASGLLVLFTFS